MLVLAETSVGFCIFKLNDQAKLESKDLWKQFETPEAATSALQLQAIHRFQSTASAVEDITAIQDGRLSASLQEFLTSSIAGAGADGKKSKKSKSALEEKLIVSDPKLAGTINKTLSIPVMSDSSGGMQDLYRGIRQQLGALLGGVDESDLSTMSLGLGHSLSRFKLKFSTDKVDTMVIQAIALLDDLDKEINIYSMRVKEWYGWHFPEMGKIITDNLAYAKVVRAMGFRTNAATTSLEHILPEELEATLKAAAELSMGTEISDSDIDHIHSLCDQVISITEYRTQLSDYLRNRMQAIAPNLTALVGELVGARLISHSGSLNSLAKAPASTIQILGAEKALFRALKTKHDTPKYGLIYHASLIGQAPQKLKGKMARMVATKAALSIRVDALSDADSKSTAAASNIGIDSRLKLESRLRALEHRAGLPITQARSERREMPKFEMQNNGAAYNTQVDDVKLLATQPVQDAIANGESTHDIAMDAIAEVKKEKSEDKKDKKKKRKSEAAQDGAPNGIEVDGEGDVEGETKEQKKARKEAKKAAKALAQSSAALSQSTPDTPTNGDKKSKKRKAGDLDDAEEKKGASGDADGEKKKKKKKRESVA
ncbi:Nucleolar protein 58 [Naganishia friedmannii]|uniref:Nucleolar protein 58 n=1 Tax=Naganishia friedmannii TaxID=89922 RepID=A0ACC2W3E8_9TREE|nr:Nucleolar protein 58 [Naganishia friedmannii]